MLVEVFSGPEAEQETAVAHLRDGRPHLGHDRGMVANDRAGHHRHQLHARGPGGDGTEHAPGERTLALLLEPGMEMIGDHGEIEAGLLRQFRIADQVFWPGLLAHQRVTEACH